MVPVKLWQVQLLQGGVITYKNYVHFTDGIGFTLPFTINADYKITVVFNDTVYKLDIIQIRESGV